MPVPPTALADLHAGRFAKAEADLRQALALDASDAQAWHLLGVCLAQTGRPEACLPALERALALAPELDDARFALGTTLLRLNRPAPARDALQAYVARQDGNSWAWNNLGLAHKALGELPAAAAALARSIACDPRNDLAHANLSNVLYLLGRYAQARAAAVQALQLRPDNHLTRWNLGLCRLLLGEWPEAWDDFEARWQQRGHPLFAPRPFFERPRLAKGAAVAGRSIFLHAEQGLGDTLHFSRYALELERAGARVVLEVPAALAPLLARSFAGRVQVIAHGAPIPAFDAYCPLLSVPWALQTRIATIPSEVPYLQADPQRVQRWRERLGAAARPRLGVIWSSGLSNPQRDVPLERLLALDLGGYEVLALQVDASDADRAALARHRAWRWVGGDVADFDDTAALLALCDVVFSVDTASAHLAGALARPLALLLPFAADWRWLLNRADTPWYPTARLYRQVEPGDWDAPLAQALRDLKDRVAPVPCDGAKGEP